MTAFLIVLNFFAGIGNIALSDGSAISKCFGFANTLMAGFLIGQAITARPMAPSK